MKTVHWVAYKGSGMHNVAASISAAERDLGLDSHLVNIHEITTEQLDEWADADIHVAHTHFPNEMRGRLTRPFRLVWVSHGTPEHVFHSALEEKKKGYGHGDSWMLFQHWLSRAHARVTFWERHRAIMQTMVDTGTKVHCLPLGVNLEFWKKGNRRNPPFVGQPSLWTSENCHWIKTPLDLLLMWPWIYEAIPAACLHLNYLPNDQHRYFFPLVNRNGASYGAHISEFVFPHTELREIFKSVDFFIGLVRYGDHNHLSLQASAAGAKTISYSGNVYSDFWIPEGDQRVMAEALIRILQGRAEPREKTPVPDIRVTAEGMREVYESITN